MSTLPSAKAPPETPALWEERSAKRVLETGRDQILERSRKIVEAAYDLLEEEGLEGLTIRAVLNKTGLSRRAFYERFEGKDDLVLAVFEQTIRNAALFFADAIAKLADPMERLKFILTYIVLGKSMIPSSDGGIDNRRGAALSREHLRLAESRPHELQMALKPLIDLIAQELAAGMAAGVVRHDDSQRLAVLVYNVVSTTVHSELLASENLQPDQTSAIQLASDIWEFCRRAIAA